MTRGFTLIELLLVISIIALLTGLTLPALSKSRQTARTIVCTSNQKQIALTMGIYQDQYGTLPFADEVPVNGWALAGYTDWEMPKDTFTCPELKAYNPNIWVWYRPGRIMKDFGAEPYPLPEKLRPTTRHYELFPKELLLIEPVRVHQKQANAIRMDLSSAPTKQPPLNLLDAPLLTR